MDIRATLLAAQLDEQAPVIDLHEADSVAGALVLLDQHVHHLYAAGENYCRVIHGVGEGILMRAVHKALSEHPLVAAWEVENHGGSSVVVIDEPSQK